MRDPGAVGALTYALRTVPFFQAPPALGNQYLADRALRSYLGRALPDDVLRSVEPELASMGELAGGRLYALQQEGGGDEPKLVQWDPWGHRVDRIELTPLWREAARVACEHGVVATAYERRHGEYSRVHQFALVYLFDASTGVYTCPLAMTDGAARTLTVHGNRPLIERALPRLTSRDPTRAWTSGQWMTERTGGSDVAISETVARRDPAGGGFRLYGTKWFTSATTSEMALTLARPEGNPPGGAGLALFYVEVRDETGRMRQIAVNRLKDKLGTRMVPTAELTLDGAPAIPVAGLTDGIRHIAPMLNITRTWNSVCACAGMRRGLALARDYARKRVAFGASLADKPLHVDTLAGLEAELQGALLLAFRAVELLGREEAETLTEEEAQLLRMLTPIVKATTARQAVAVASEVLEAFGGAGYVEDTGLPRLLRDAQVLPIWEGTTNVLSLDTLRILGKTGTLAAEGPSAVSPQRGLYLIEREVGRLVARAASADCARAGEAATRAGEHATAWLAGARPSGPGAIEAGARRLTLTLGRAIELALLVDHAAWAAERGDSRPAAAARRFAANGVDLVRDEDGEGGRAPARGGVSAGRSSAGRLRGLSRRQRIRATNAASKANPSIATRSPMSATQPRATRGPASLPSAVAAARRRARDLIAASMMRSASRTAATARATSAMASPNDRRAASRASRRGNPSSATHRGVGGAEASARHTDSARSTSRASRGSAHSEASGPNASAASSLAATKNGRALEPGPSFDAPSGLPAATAQ